jgi:hypothetical protein
LGVSWQKKKRQGIQKYQRWRRTVAVSEAEAQAHRHSRKGKKKKTKKTRAKKKSRQKATDRLSFCVCFLLARRHARRLWTCHRMWAPAAGCGVFLYELVPSDDPFMSLYGVFAKHFFRGNFCFQRTFFISSEKQIKFVMSTTTTRVLPYKVNPIRTSAYTTSPLSSSLFALCVRCFVFEEEKELP